MDKKTLFGLVIVGFIAFTVLKPTALTTDIKRQRLMDFINMGGGSPESKQRMLGVFGQMSISEIDATYTFVFEYLQKGRSIPNGSSLYYQIEAISSKYQIFT